jgi:hypothetical protein
MALRADAQRHHQVQLRWQVLNQEGERLVDRPGIQQVVVVKHEDRRLRQRGELVEQQRQQRLDGRGLGGLERRHHPDANRRRNRLQRGDKVRQKAGRVTIPLVQREPGGGAPAAGDPRAGQAGFPKAGRGRDQGQPAVQPFVQPRDQVGAEHRVRPWGRDKQLGRQHWGGHSLL